VIGVTALRPAVPGNVHHRVRPQGAGEHPDQADPAHVGIRGRLDHLGQQRAARIAGQAAHRRAVQRGDDGQRVLLRGRECLGHHLQQLGEADAAAGGGREHRVEAAAGDRLLQVLDEYLDVDVLVRQVAVHQRLVFALLDDRLDQRAAVVGDPVGLPGVRIPFLAAAARVVVEPLRQQADQAADGAGVADDRQVQRRDGVTERVPAGGERLVEVTPLVVDLGDHDGAGRAGGGAFVPQHPGQAVDAVGGGDREQGRVGGPQAGPQLGGEIGVSGGVQQVDLDAAMQDRREGQVHRALLPDLDLVEVAHGRPVLDPAGPLDRPGAGEQGLHQRRLARSGMADQHDIAHAVRLAGRRHSARSRRAPCLVRHRRRLPRSVPAPTAFTCRPPDHNPSATIARPTRR